MNRFHYGILIFLLLFSWSVSGRQTFFQSVTIQTDDSTTFDSQNHWITYGNISGIVFVTPDFSPIIQVSISFQEKYNNIPMEVLESPDFIVLDSVANDTTEMSFRLQIKKISSLIRVYFRIIESKEILCLNLLPTIAPAISFNPANHEIYLGETKTYQLTANQIDYFSITPEWVEQGEIKYRLSKDGQNINVHIWSNTAGKQRVTLKLKTQYPYYQDSLHRLNYDITLPPVDFDVKKVRLPFINCDKQEITFDDKIKREGAILVIDAIPGIQVGQTYRIEAQEAPGGRRIGELFIKESVYNDKMICLLYPEVLHRITNGYLYLKLNDVALFIVNMDITPQFTIQSLSVMRDGKNWINSNEVYPGENIMVKVQGLSLYKGNLKWEGVDNVVSDTLETSETVRFFKISIPITITTNKIELINFGVNTGQALVVKESQRPRQLDFVNVNFSGKDSPMDKISNQTYILRKAISDVTFTFNTKLIDQNNVFYGKQYLNFDIKYYNPEGRLMEYKTLENVLICPYEKSTRGAFYKDPAEQNTPISLNSLFTTKANNLDDYSRVSVKISHNSEKYSAPPKVKQLDLVLQRPWRFDIDISFPVGMLLQNLGTSQTDRDKIDRVRMEQSNWDKSLALGKITDNPDLATESLPYVPRPSEPPKAKITDNVGAIAIAVIAQFSFPEARRVGKEYPWRIGAGFIVVNALNFTSELLPDLAGVVVGSIYLLPHDKVFNIPIHVGFGYKINDKVPFFMLTPGISLRF